MQTLETNLARVLAHSVVFESRKDDPNYEFFNDESFLGDPDVPGTTQQGESIANSFKANLPSIIATLAEQVGILDKARLGAAGDLAQGEAAIQEGLVPVYERIARAARAAEEASNPELAALRSTATSQLGNLIGSYGITGLSPAEQQAAERAINAAAVARGNADVRSNTQTTQDALAFDDRRKENLDRLNQALITATQFIPASQVGTVNAGREAIDATAPGRFGGSNAGQAGLQIGSQLLGGLTGLEQQRIHLNATKEDLSDKMEQHSRTYSNIASGTGKLAAMCWVAREVLGTTDNKWLLFRAWLMHEAPAWFRSLYTRFGERFARWVSNKPRLKSCIKYWMLKKIGE